MNLTENYQYLKDINNSEVIKISDIVFTTKNISENIINSDNQELIQTIYELIEYNNVKVEIIEVIELSKRLSEEEKYDILSALIEFGVPRIQFYAEELGLKFDNIHIDVYLEGIKKGGYPLFGNSFYISYINSYINPKKLKKEIGLIGYIEQYNYFMNENEDLVKLNNEEGDLFIKNFKKRYNLYSTYEKVILLGVYNWDAIIQNVFDDPDKVYKKIIDIFTLNKKNKKELEILKREIFSDQYIDDLIEIRNNIKSRNFSIKNEIKSDDINSDNEIENILNKELLDIGILKNEGNSFEITFIDLSGKKTTLLLSSVNFELNNINDSYYDFNIFNNKVLNTLKFFINNKNKNNIEFTIFVSKSNGNKDGMNNDGLNNENYSGKGLKVA